jgi:DNA-binding MarR family transcriptional regulator
VKPVHPRFDPVVHAPNRLQVCALLSAVEDADFSVLRDELGVSDSVLSKHLRVLEEAGYLVLRKPTVASRVRTRAELTDAGRRAFAGHVAELRRLVALGDTAGRRQPTEL